MMANPSQIAIDPSRARAPHRDQHAALPSTERLQHLAKRRCPPAVDHSRSFSRRLDFADGSLLQPESSLPRNFAGGTGTNQSGELICSGEVGDHLSGALRVFVDQHGITR